MIKETYNDLDVQFAGMGEAMDSYNILQPNIVLD